MKKLLLIPVLMLSFVLVQAQTTMLIEDDCARTDVGITDVLTAYEVGNASNYEFWVENSALGFSEKYVGPDYAFTLAHLNATFEDFTVYTVKVRAEVEDRWGDYGEICEITTGAISAGPDPICYTIMPPPASNHEEAEALAKAKAFFDKNLLFGGSATIDIPIQFHIVDNGTPDVPTPAVITSHLNILNQYFAPVGFVFKECAPRNIIADPNSDYNIDSSIPGSKPGYINVFYVFNPSGGTGGKSGVPSNKLKMSLGGGAVTLAHEMGHAFGLMHTHGYCANSGDCEPEDIVELAIRDYNPTKLYPVPNCWTQGDELCDTEADPRLNTTDASGSNYIYVGQNAQNCAEYIGTIKDKNNDLYTPELENIMGYNPHRCNPIFTPQQMNRMYYYTYFTKENINKVRFDLDISNPNTNPLQVEATFNMDISQVVSNITVSVQNSNGQNLIFDEYPPTQRTFDFTGGNNNNFGTGYNFQPCEEYLVTISFYDCNNNLRTNTELIRTNSDVGHVPFMDINILQPTANATFHPGSNVNFVMDVTNEYYTDAGMHIGVKLALLDLSLIPNELNSASITASQQTIIEPNTQEVIEFIVDDLVPLGTTPGQYQICIRTHIGPIIGGTTCYSNCIPIQVTCPTSISFDFPTESNGFGFIQLDRTPNATSVDWTVEDLTTSQIITDNFPSSDIFTFTGGNFSSFSFQDCHRYKITISYVDLCGGLNTPISYTKEVVYPPGGTYKTKPKVTNYATTFIGQTYNIKGYWNINDGQEFTFENCTFNFSNEEPSGIIVDLGSKLILDNTTMTGICGGMWEGIEVWGDKNYNVTMSALDPTNPQGAIVIRNGSVIENAHNAVRLGSASEPDKEGAVMLAIGSTFKNNRNSVIVDNNAEANVKIEECIFLNDAPMADPQYNGEGMDNFVTLIGARAELRGNTYTNSVSTLDDDQKGTAVNSLFSDVILVPKMMPNQPGVIKTRNQFQDVYKGVDHFSVGGLRRLLIENCDFTNVNKCITSNNSNFDVIKQNNFVLRAPIFASDAAYAVYMFNSESYEITENSVDGVSNNPGKPTYGIVARGESVLGGFSGTIYKNDASGTATGLENLTYAMQVEGKNELLDIQCNEMTGYINGMRLTNANISGGGSVAGELSNLGDCIPQTPTMPNGNVFDPCVGTVDQVVNLSVIGFDFSDIAANNVSQNCASSNINVITCLPNQVNECLPLGGGGGGSSKSLTLQGLSTQMGYTTSSGVQTYPQGIKDKLMRLYLQNGFMSDAESFMAGESDKHYHKLKMAHALEQQDFATCQMLLDSLPLDTTEDVEIRMLFQLLLNLASNGKSLQDINPSERLLVDAIANNNTEVHVIAEGILSLLDGSEYNRIPENPASSSAPRTGSGSEDPDLSSVNLSVSPNPNKGFFHISYDIEEKSITDDAKSYTLEVRNIVTGQLIKDYIAEGRRGTQSVDLSNLSDGIYVIQLKDGDVILKSEKVSYIK